MKKFFITFLTAISLTFSATSFASVNQDDSAYLFGTEEAIEVQMISDAEMQATEGQLFGINFETASSILNLAYTYFKPYLGNLLGAFKDKAFDAIKARFQSFLISSALSGAL